MIKEEYQHVFLHMFSPNPHIRIGSPEPHPKRRRRSVPLLKVEFVILSSFMPQNKYEDYD